jgi:hypothetical protein
LHLISLARTRASMDCARHLLDSDEMIFVLERRKPRLDQPVVHDTAERYHGAATAWFDPSLSTSTGRRVRRAVG